jgi:hypothetical protein
MDDGLFGAPIARQKATNTDPVPFSPIDKRRLVPGVVKRLAFWRLLDLERLPIASESRSQTWPGVFSRLTRRHGTYVHSLRPDYDGSPKA